MSTVLISQSHDHLDLDQKQDPLGLLQPAAVSLSTSSTSHRHSKLIKQERQSLSKSSNNNNNYNNNNSNTTTTTTTTMTPPTATASVSEDSTKSTHQKRSSNSKQKQQQQQQQSLTHTNTPCHSKSAKVEEMTWQQQLLINPFPISTSTTPTPTTTDTTTAMSANVTGSSTRRSTDKLGSVSMDKQQSGKRGPVMGKQNMASSMSISSLSTTPNSNSYMSTESLYGAASLGSPGSLSKRIKKKKKSGGGYGAGGSTGRHGDLVMEGSSPSSDGELVVSRKGKEKSGKGIEKPTTTLLQPTSVPNTQPHARRLSAPDPSAFNYIGPVPTTPTEEKEMLYAGATFQNSPAAERLPIPVFGGGKGKVGRKSRGDGGGDGGGGGSGEGEGVFVMDGIGGIGGDMHEGGRGQLWMNVRQEQQQHQQQQYQQQQLLQQEQQHLLQQKQQQVGYVHHGMIQQSSSHPPGLHDASNWSHQSRFGTALPPPPPPQQQQIQTQQQTQIQTQQYMYPQHQTLLIDQTRGVVRSSEMPMIMGNGIQYQHVGGVGNDGVAALGEMSQNLKSLLKIA